jgi:hypothetical protein
MKATAYKISRCPHKNPSKLAVLIALRASASCIISDIAQFVPSSHARAYGGERCQDGAAQGADRGDDRKR